MRIIIYSFLLLRVLNSFSQKSFNDYAQFYPIGDDPYIRLMTSYVKQEKILFDAYPILKFSIFNNFIKGLMNGEEHTQAWYISFRPQLRMYTDNSLPVKTPSYKILLGTQHLFRIGPLSDANKEYFWGFSIESGHYSNGQEGCAFSEKYDDGSKSCDSIYNLISSSSDLSELLNRKSCNFSTNLTELLVNFRKYCLDDDYIPKNMHSINLGYILYHNRFLGIADFGGYTEDDIRIYGRHRFLLGYEWMKVLKKYKDKRISVKLNTELIHKPHNSVNPFRGESTFIFYPFPKSKSLGFLLSLIYGHDNYNYRFVDSGFQVAAGINWCQFPPFTIKK